MELFNENSEIEKSLPAGILCLSSSISGIKYQERLQQQFITCDDIFIEGARQKAHHIFIIFSSVQTKKLVLGTESDKLDRHFTLACWPPKHNVLYIKYYCCFTELYLISYLFSRFKDPIHSCQGGFFSVVCVKSSQQSVTGKQSFSHICSVFVLGASSHSSEVLLQPLAEITIVRSG